jgi:hypothetical protein
MSLMAMLATGCLSDITKVNERDVIPPDQLTTSAGAQALYVGALRSFGIAFDGNNGGAEGQILISGLMSDEWSHSGTFNTRRDYDQRATDLNNGTLSVAFRNLQDARTSAERAITAVENTSDNPAADARIGALQNRIGAVYLAGAQNYCNGVPYTEVVGGDLQYGDPLTGDQEITTAISWFDKAIAGPAGTGSVNLYTAQLLKARALMLQGSAQYGAAAALVAGVPTSFRAVSDHSIANGGNENGIYVFNWLSERWTMSQNEGGNGLPFRGAGNGTDPAQADPRLPWQYASDSLGFDKTTPQFNWEGSVGRDASMPFAKGEEARLIEAEAALANNDITTFMTKLNDLRTTVAGLAPLTDPGTTAGRVDMLFSERGFWLYSTGVRLSDMRRLIRQYGRGAETVFPTGAYHKPGNYGTDVNIPVILDETQNPNFTACLDRNP